MDADSLYKNYAP